MLGAQYGLKPNELLDLSYQEMQAYLVGSQEAQVDQLVLAMQSGYWSGYYSNSKKPKPLKAFIKKIDMGRSYNRHEKIVEGPDVEKFLELEKRRLGGESIV